MPETLAYRSPLTLQFSDPVTGYPVADRLAVAAWPQGDPSCARAGRPSPVSAHLSFGPLPGSALPDEARAADPETFNWPPPGPGRLFEVRVVDTARRFLPELVVVSVPQLTLVSYPMFSAPNRPTLSGFATIAGEVHTVSPAGPAPWAIVRVTSGANTYMTLTDQAGRYLVYFPYPEALPPLNPSPPPGPPAGVPTWPVSVSVCYQPSAQQVLGDAAPTDPPELGSILAQAPAAIASGGSTQPTLPATLSFGAPLLLMLEVVPA
jgi:hypothetical protein